jgi:hypothetical protein
MSFAIPFAFFDPPVVIDTQVTPIPASTSAPLQVIADSGVNIGIGISYIDMTNAFIGVYVGIRGHEQLICIIGNGISSIAWGRFPPNSRVCLRAMENLAITNGQLSGSLVTR